MRVRVLPKFEQLIELNINVFESMGINDLVPVYKKIKSTTMTEEIC